MTYVFYTRLREAQRDATTFWKDDLNRDKHVFMDMFGDFHTQFAFLKTIFRAYWTEEKTFGLAQIAARLKRKSIKKDCKIYFEAEELILHIFQGFNLALATKILDSGKFSDTQLGPKQVFELVTDIVKNVRIHDDFRNPSKDHFITNIQDATKSLIHLITIFFYFKKAIRSADGFSVLRSMKYLFINFLGIRLLIFCYFIFKVTNPLARKLPTV